MQALAATERSDVDVRVVERAKRGDQQAFAALVRHYDHGLRALAFRLLGDRERMDDALQEAYVRAFRYLPKFRGDAAFGTWLYRIAYNACMDELRRTQNVVQLPLDDVLERRDERRHHADVVVERKSLADALAALPPEHRAAVLLVDAEGFDYAAAGEILGVPAGTVASRLNRARAALRLALESQQEGVGDR